MRLEHIEEIIDEFVERAHAAVWCNVATIDPRGRVQSRILHPIWDRSTGYIGTRRGSPKAAHLDHSPYVSLAYINDIVRPTYAECVADWCDDPAEREHVWNLYKNAPPPLGFDYGTIFPNAGNPAFGLIRLRPWRIKVQESPTVFRIWEREIS